VDLYRSSPVGRDGSCAMRKAKRPRISPEDTCKLLDERISMCVGAASALAHAHNETRRRTGRKKTLSGYRIGGKKLQGQAKSYRSIPKRSSCRSF
jgi:hypothetical protein